MKTFLSILIFVLLSISTVAQNKTANGNWNNPALWSAGNIGDDISENILISQNVTTYVLANESYSIGDLTLSQNNKLYVNANGNLTVGAIDNLKTFTTDQNNELYIDGNFKVYGPVNVPQNIVIKINGSFSIYGDLTMGQNVNLEINTGAKLEIFGNFTTAQNANVNVSGTGQALIYGDVSPGNGSNLNSPANGFQFGGTCTGPVNFCNKATFNVALPITLTEFEVKETVEGAMLNWVTLSEINFDEFVIERSISDLDFKAIGSVSGNGNSNQRNEYLFVDPEKFKERVYYRLKSVDYDGFFEYSKVISFQSKDVEDYFNIVNPSDDGFLKYKTNIQSHQIRVYDLNGQQQDTSVRLKNGFYVVKFESLNYHRSLKLLVK